MVTLLGLVGKHEVCGGPHGCRDRAPFLGGEDHAVIGRAWKGFDWATTDRLFKKGLIGDPVNKSKSLILTDEGLERSKALFVELFTRPPR